MEAARSMSRANRLKRRNTTGEPRNKRALGIVRQRIEQAAKAGRPAQRGWERTSHAPMPNSQDAMRRADEKRARRRQRRLDVDRHGYVR